MPDSNKIEIKEEEFFLRRIPISTNPEVTYIKPDGSISSLAFQPSPKDMKHNGLSVNIKSMSSYDETILDPEKHDVIEFQVKESRNLGLEDEHLPLDDNIAHAVIYGLTRDKKGRAVRKGLAKKASLLKG